MGTAATLQALEQITLTSVSVKLLVVAFFFFLQYSDVSADAGYILVTCFVLEVTVPFMVISMSDVD